MASIFTRKDAASQQVNYSVEKLLVRASSRKLDGHSKKAIICDIDKTYLETEFETFVQMAKTAIEDADEKRTVDGAHLVLSAARWHSVDGKPNPLHFVTASPPQLKLVLEKKLRIDDVQWNSIIFKNQAYNIRKGRMSLLRDHIAYKTLALHNVLLESGENTSAFMIGDNAELDSFIYTGLSLFLNGTLSKKGYKAYLASAGTDSQVIDELMDLISPVSGCKIAGIYIRKVPGYTTYKAGKLTESIFYFGSFLELALEFYLKDLVDRTAIWPLVRSFHNAYGLERKEIGRYLVDAEQVAQGAKKEFLKSLLDRLIYSRGIDLEELRSSIEERQTMNHDKKLSEDEVLVLAHDWMEWVRKNKS